MTHHQRNIFLFQVIKRFAFRKYAANEFMSYFNPAFLVGTLRITVEHSGSAFAFFVKLNGERISKLTATVCQND